MFKVALISGLVIACGGCRGTEMERKSMDGGKAVSYVAWPSQSAYEGTGAVYIPVQAIPMDYPLSALIEPPQPFGPDSVEVSDGIAVMRGAADEVRLIGGKLKDMAQIAGALQKEGLGALEDVYWHDLTECKERRVERVVKSSMAGASAKALLCANQLTAYVDGRKVTCAAPRELVARFSAADELEIGITASGDPAILLYEAGAPTALNTSCASGDRRELSIGEQKEITADRIVQVEQIFKVRDDWLMVATVRLGDGELSYVLFSFDSKPPLVLGTIKRSKLYISERNALAVRIENNTLPESLGDRTWNFDIYDLMRSKHVADWQVVFGHGDSSGFAYTVRAAGADGKFEQHDAQYAVP